MSVFSLSEKRGLQQQLHVSGECQGASDSGILGLQAR